MSRKQIVAGNWKMNKSFQEGISLAKEIVLNTELNHQHHEVILCPPHIHLAELSNIVEDSPVKLGAQNCHQEDKGAFTGEVSASMLASLGTDYVILGHSERRMYFAESNELLADKVNQALANHLQPIYCCGEKLEERGEGRHFNIVGDQISEGLFHLSEADFRKVVIAYEPVWAIGTGKTASDEQAQEMHAHIRKLVQDKYGEATANACSILYGGSVKPGNAAGIFAQPDVDGGLIGGASLVAEDFLAIVAALPH